MCASTHTYMHTLTSHVNKVLPYPEGGGGVWVQMFGGLGTHTHVILVLREYIWNESADSLVLPTFHNTGSLGTPPHKVVYFQGSTLGDCLPFPCRE